MGSGGVRQLCNEDEEREEERTAKEGEQEERQGNQKKEKGVMQNGDSYNELVLSTNNQNKMKHPSLIEGFSNVQ